MNYPCEDITVDTCYHPSFADNITIEEYHVLYSILGIWTWYNSVWEAASIATLKADLPVGDIVAEINPVLPGDTSLGVLLSALSAGLAFLGLPAGGRLATKLIATGVDQAPGLVKALLPTGSQDSEIKQMDEIEDNLGVILDQFQAIIANALNTTQSDFTTFFTAVTNGTFIADQASLNATTSGLTRFLKTFVVSQALQANNVIITRAENISAYDLSQKKFTSPENGTMLPQNAEHVNCQDEPDEHGVCDNWWIDSSAEGNSTSYSLFKLDDMTKNFHDLKETIFSNGWTTGKDLFFRSVACLGAEVLSPSPFINAITFKPSCFSNLRFCNWNHSIHPVLHDGHELEPGYGCSFAWPNLYVKGQGHFANVSGGMPEHATNFPDTSGSPYFQKWGGYASVLTNSTSSNGALDPDPLIQQGLQSYFPVNFVGDPPTYILAFNSLYDLFNNNMSALVQQAAKKKSKQCKSWPDGNNFPGWGGAGYHRIDDACDVYPASYIGPGLWMDTNFC